MKTKNIFSLFLAMMLTITLSSFEMHDLNKPLSGNSYSDFGDYVITLSEDPLEIDGVSLETYDLVYQNLDDVVKIAVDNKKRCTNYIVKHPGFECQYTCNKYGFGARLISSQYASLDPMVVSYLMDGEQFECQAKLVTEEKSNAELLHMIAGYFPKLIDEDVRKLVKKS